MTGKKQKYKDYESAVQRLEEITEQLESGEPGLEQAIELYTEGLEIAQFCDKKLTEAEKKIKIITEKSGQYVEEDFDTSEDEEDDEEEEE
jgi:exodeoxyribonuclease VII small subunit